MKVQDLLTSQPELERLLRTIGPIQFVRQLLALGRGAQVLAHDSRQLDPRSRATRFLFVDTHGAEALLTILSQTLSDGKADYRLSAELRLLQ